MGQSLAEQLAQKSEVERKAFYDSLTQEEAARLEFDWRGFWARPEQLVDWNGDWQYWFYMAGRGSGKSRSGAECVIEYAQTATPGPAGMIALVGPTVDDARDVLLEGESGLLAHSPPWFKPEWHRSDRTVAWPNGVIGRTYSADRPDRLRGKQHAFAWCDELCAWREEDAWTQLQLGMRLGTNPRTFISTTPKPTELIKALVENPITKVVYGTTYDNRSNLAPQFFEKIIKEYENTRLGEQELLGRLLFDEPNALWKRSQIDKLRRSEPPALRRVVVAVDPAVSANPKSDETGIVVCALGIDGHLYVLDDLSDRMTPGEWSKRALLGYMKWHADCVVAEVNNGGDLVEQNLRAALQNLPVKKVHASRGKMTRAEPIAHLYERGLVHHVGNLLWYDATGKGICKLEDQMASWNPQDVKSKSPDRIDALVWGLTELSGITMSRARKRDLSNLW